MSQAMLNQFQKKQNVLGFQVCTDTFICTKQLIANRVPNQNMDPDVALSLISLDRAHFATEVQVIAELLEILQNVCNCQRQLIIAALLKYYQNYQQQYYTQVSQSVKALIAISQIASSTVATPLAQISGLDTPSKKFKPREVFSANIILKNLQNKQKQIVVDPKAGYMRQIEDAPSCFGKPIQSKVTYLPGVKEILEFELKQLQHLAQKERQLGLEDFDLDEPPQQFIFPGNKQPFVKVQQPQVHPGLLQLLAPPSQFFPQFYAKIGPLAHSQKQIEIQFSNEIQDDPDLTLEVNRSLVLLKNEFRTPQVPLFRCPSYRLKTQKPTPQHHAFIDLPGIYAPLSEVLEALCTELAVVQKNNQAQNLPFTFVDVLERAQYIVYFPPLDFCVDQRCFGNESRFARFATSEQATCYLKAVGVGGGVRLQIHAARDLGADEELTLGMEYSIIKNQEMYLQFMNLYDQLRLISNNEPWVPILLEKFEVGSADYNKFLTSAVPTYLLTIINQELAQTQISVQIEDLTQYLSKLCRYNNFSHKDCVHIKADPANQADTFTVNKSNVIGVSTEELHCYGDQVGSLIMKNLLMGKLMTQQSLSQFDKSMKPDFNNFIQNYSVQRLYSFFDFVLKQNKFAVGQAQRDQITKYLDQLNIPLLPNKLYIKTYPTFYVNWCPFSGFDPLTYNVFDKGLDKLMINALDLIKARFKESFQAIDGFDDDVLNKLLLKFVQQNFSFNLLMQGADVTVEQYYEDVVSVIHGKNYVDIDYILSEVIPINEDKLQSYVQTKNIEDLVSAFMEPKFNYARLFVSQLDSNLTRFLGEDLIKYMCSEICDVLESMPPLNKKIKYEVKSQVSNAVQWPGSVSGFSKVGYDGAYGYKYSRDHKMIISQSQQQFTVKTSKIRQPVQQTDQQERKLFSEEMWGFFRSREQAINDGVWNQLLQEAEVRNKKRVVEFQQQLAGWKNSNGQ